MVKLSNRIGEVDKMNKRIIVIGIPILLLIFGGLYAIDHHRMSNNEPVLFSTWGKQYVPPEYLILKDIEDKTQKQNIAVMMQKNCFMKIVKMNIILTV